MRDERWTGRTGRVRWRSGWLPGAAALLLALTGCGPTAGLGEDLVSRTGPPVLGVEGNLLVAGGEREVLAGVTLYALPFYDDGRGGPDVALQQTTDRVWQDRARVLDRIRAAGADTVRVPLGTSAVVGDPYGLGGLEGYVRRLRDLVEDAAARDLRVLVAWWDSHSTGEEWPSRWTEAQDGMRAVHAALEPWPGVLYEPFNEPHGVSADEWERTTRDVVRWWREDLGHDGVLVLDTPDWSWSFDAVRAARLQELDADLRDAPSALVFANHRYSNRNPCFCAAERAAWQLEVGRHVPRFPILGTEYGTWNGPDNPREPVWDRQLADHLVHRAVPEGLNGYVAFTWDWVDDNSMTEQDGTRLNGWGRLVRDRVLEPLSRR